MYESRMCDYIHVWIWMFLLSWGSTAARRCICPKRAMMKFPRMLNGFEVFQRSFSVLSLTLNVMMPGMTKPRHLRNMYVRKYMCIIWSRHHTDRMSGRWAVRPMGWLLFTEQHYIGTIWCAKSSLRLVVAIFTTEWLLPTEKWAGIGVYDIAGARKTASFNVRFEERYVVATPT